MRSLVRRYSVSIQVEGESDLRLMAQPLFRYPEAVAGVVDGAVFSFAMSTDPELLVLLEDREAAGKPAWHVAFARFGNKAMTVKDGERRRPALASKVRQDSPTANTTCAGVPKKCLTADSS